MLMRRTDLPGGTVVDEAGAIAPSTALVGGPLPTLEDVTSWIGSPRSPVDSLEGRVKAVAFLSFNMPGSIRVLPRLEAWHDAYSRYGLDLAAVQVPEFAFGAEPAAFEAAVRRFRIGFPIGLDPSPAAWRTFGPGGDRPRVVIADSSGRVTFDSSGVAAVPAAEREILRLLQEARPELRFPAVHVEAPAAESSHHPPVHLGRARVEGGPLAKTPAGRATTFTAQLRYQVDGEPFTPYPVGRWELSADGLIAARGGAENFIALRYDGGALGAVMAPPEIGPVRVWVLCDERWLTPEEQGADVRLDGRGASYVMVDEARHYALTREAPGSHLIKLSPDVAGATFYTFTFEPSVPVATGP